MPQSRINSTSFFIIFFATTAIYVYVNTFLPVFFYNVLNIDRVKLAFIQLLSYSALFIKPLFAILSDKYAQKNFKRKPYIIISGIMIPISFFALTLTITELIIFGIFLGINFMAISLINVSVNGMIIDSSPTIEIKNRKIFITKVGASLGAIFPNIIFLLFMYNIYSIQSWYLFLSFGFLFLIPLVFIIPFIKEEHEESNNDLLNESVSIEDDPNVFTISFIAMCIFIFLLYSDKLIEFPLEPWIIEKFGVESFFLFSFFMIIGIFLNILGFIIGTYFLRIQNRKRILGILTIICGVFEIIFGFINFLTFLILMAIIQVLVGIISINLASLMMDFAKYNKVIYYQIIASFFTLAVIIFIPLGTLLSSFISTELLFIISGILLILSIIPLSQIKLNLSQ